MVDNGAEARVAAQVTVHRLLHPTLVLSYECAVSVMRKGSAPHSSAAMSTQFLTKCPLVNITLCYSGQDLHSLVQQVQQHSKPCHVSII